VVTFALAFLGASLRAGSGWLQALICGTTALLLFAVGLYAATSSAPTSSEREADAPWLVFAAYALLGAFVTAFGRRNFGVDFALQSHYDAIALFLPLGTIGLVASCWPRVVTRLRRAWTIATAAIVLLTFGVDLHGVEAVRRYANERRAEIAAIRGGDASLITVLAYPRPGDLRRMLEEMRTVHDGPYFR
jgi:hypothetical protein